MPDVLQVEFQGLTGRATVGVAEGTTVGAAAAEAGLSDELSFATGGRSVQADAPVSPDARYTTAAPQVKQGR